MKRQLPKSRQEMRCQTNKKSCAVNSHVAVPAYASASNCNQYLPSVQVFTEAPKVLGGETCLHFPYTCYHHRHPQFWCGYCSTHVQIPGCAVQPTFAIPLNIPYIPSAPRAACVSHHHPYVQACTNFTRSSQICKSSFSNLYLPNIDESFTE